jgi:hypothetical protein
VLPAAAARSVASVILSTYVDASVMSTKVDDLLARKPARSRAGFLAPVCPAWLDPVL